MGDRSLATPANTVSVLSGARCNATVTAGCGAPVATIPVGEFPQGIALNEATMTLYVANTDGNSVSVINVAKCNAVTISGCQQPVKTIPDSLAPADVAVNQATDTVYVVNGQHTMSVINGASCSATVTSGCGHSPRVVATGNAPSFDAIDPALHALFVINQNDNTVSEINTATCSASVPSGCPEQAPSTPVPANVPKGFNADAVALVPQTDTMYLVDAGGVDFLVVAGIPD